MPLPMRVFVRGASTVGWSGVMDGPRTDLGFPRVIERDLLASGQAAVVVSRTVGGMRTNTVLREWERDVVGFSPDAVVIMAVHYETLHVLWPQRLERHANSMTWAPRRLGTLYRKRVLRPAWRALVKLQTKLEDYVPDFWWRRRIDHAVADVAKAAAQMRRIASPLIILMEVPRPSAPGRYLFPRMPERVDYANRRLAELVARFGEDDVRLFRTNDAVEAYADGDREVALPDGFHFAPGLHEAVGHQLAEELASWAQTQPHLKA